MFKPPPAPAASTSRGGIRTAAGRVLGALGILGVVVATAGGLPGLLPGVARADQPMVKYVGMHPLPPHQGEYCFIDEVHYHRAPPVDLRVYVTLKAGGQLYVGDPAWLGYDGPKVGYFGPHPLAVPLAPEAGTLFCYIAGPHYHAAAPAPSPQMVLKDGVYWYLGPPPPADVQRSWINEIHPIKGYVAPAVNVSAAPPGYHALPVSGGAPPPAPGGPGGGGAPGLTDAGGSAARPMGRPGLTGAAGATKAPPRQDVRGVKPPTPPPAAPGVSR